jgi:hypothetical protein
MEMELDMKRKQLEAEFAQKFQQLQMEVQKQVVSMTPQGFTREPEPKMMTEEEQREEEYNRRMMLANRQRERHPNENQKMAMSEKEGQTQGRYFLSGVDEAASERMYENDQRKMDQEKRRADQEMARFQIRSNVNPW